MLVSFILGLRYVDVQNLLFHAEQRLRGFDGPLLFVIRHLLVKDVEDFLGRRGSYHFFLWVHRLTRRVLHRVRLKFPVLVVDHQIEVDGSHDLGLLVFLVHQFGG